MTTTHEDIMSLINTRSANPRKGTEGLRIKLVVVNGVIDTIHIYRPYVEKGEPRTINIVYDHLREAFTVTERFTKRDEVSVSAITYDIYDTVALGRAIFWYT